MWFPVPNHPMTLEGREKAILGDSGVPTVLRSGAQMRAQVSPPVEGGNLH